MNCYLYIAYFPRMALWSQEIRSNHSEAPPCIGHVPDLGVYQCTHHYVGLYNNPRY